jgi:hypothetical protein
MVGSGAGTASEIFPRAGTAKKLMGSCYTVTSTDTDKYLRSADHLAYLIDSNYKAVRITIRFLLKFSGFSHSDFCTDLLTKQSKTNVH